MKIPTKGSRMAAGHDIYALDEGSIPANGQELVGTGIAIGLPRGTYGRLAARSGIASKNGIAVGGGVIDADYTGEVKVILRNHWKEDYQFRADDSIAQLIVERIQLDEAIEVDELEDTERGMKGFSSTDLDPKRLITSKETKVTMCFLNPNPDYNEYLDNEDIETNPPLRQEVVMLSNAIIATVHIQTTDELFLNRIRIAGKEDYSWLARKDELNRLKERNETLPKLWDMEDCYGVAVRHTAPRRMRGPSYPILEAQTSRKDNATPPSGPGVGTIGRQPPPGKLRPLTKNLKIGTNLVTPYTSQPSVRLVPVRRIYERRPSGTLCKWKQLNRSTVHKVTDTQSQLTRKCH